MNKIIYPNLDLTKNVIEWLKERQKEIGFERVVIGISGGKDSSVVAALCCAAFGAKNVHGLLMPNGEQKDITDSIELCATPGIGYDVINIETAFNGILNPILKTDGKKKVEDTKINLPARDASKKPVIVVRDGSDSMESRVDNKSQVTALDVATALAIYFAEHAHADFKDQFITFSEKPKLVSLKNLTSLKDKLIRAYREAECANTSIEAVFGLLLKTAKQAGMKQEDIPEVLIISDMEFDSCVETNATRGWSPNICQKEPNLFKTIGAKWKAAGYDLPGVTFWNVASRTNTVPMRQNKLGVKLLSGFSQNAIEMVMGDEKTPFDALKKVLLGDRYAPITF